MSLKDFQISQYIVVDKIVIKAIGLKSAIILYELAKEYYYWKKVEPKEWFYSTVDNIEENTSLSSHEQREALKQLSEMGFVEVRYRGMPKKRYIKFNESNVLQWLKNLTTSGEKIQQQVVKKINNKSLKNLTTSGENFEQQEVKNFNINNKLIIRNKNNKEEYDEDADIRF